MKFLHETKRKTLSRSSLRSIPTTLGLVAAIVLDAGIAVESNAADSDVVISEIHYHPSFSSERSEYIELCNRGSELVDLSGWAFTRGITFTFDLGVLLEPKSCLVVVADEDGFRAARPRPDVHIAGTYSGRLRNSGERVELANASGETIERLTYSDTFPYPTLPDGGGPPLERRSLAADNDRANNWRVGSPQWQFYDLTAAPTESTLVLRLLGAGEALIDELSMTLEGDSTPLIPDGGFEAGIEGWVFFPGHDDSRHETEETYAGEGALRLTSVGSASRSSNARFSIEPPLPEGAVVRLSFWVRSLSGVGLLEVGSRRESFGALELLGSPGALNSDNLSELPPGILAARTIPKMPTSSEPVTLLVQVESDADGAAVAALTAQLHDGTSTSEVTLADDGLSGDGEADDGIWAGELPPRPHGTFVRYRLVVEDANGLQDQFPIPGEPTPSRAYYVNDTPSDSNLPTFGLFLSAASLERLNRTPDVYQPGSFLFDGEVYDLAIGFDGEPLQPINATSNSGRYGIRHRGSNSLGNPKRPWKVKFPKDHPFERGEDPERFGTSRRRINFNALWTNKDLIREVLAHVTFQDLGNTHCYTEHCRIELNGDFHGLYMHIEQPDTEFLSRNGLNDDGELWKSIEGGEAKSPGNYEKETREDLGLTNLADFVRELNRTQNDTERREFIDSRVDVPNFRDYLVGTALISNADHPHKNHYMYHDVETGLWTQTPWDLDLTWGQNHECDGGCIGGMLPEGGSGRDCLRWKNHILLGSRRHQKCDGKWNAMIEAFFTSEKHNGLFRDRVLSLLEQYFTVANLEPIIDDLRDEIRVDAELDREKWGSWGDSRTWDIDERVAELKWWIDQRRQFLLDSIPAPLTDLSCGVTEQREIELTWSGDGDYRTILVRVGSPGEWGERFESFRGDARSELVPVPSSMSGTVVVHVSALGRADVYTPELTCTLELAPVTFVRADVTRDGSLALDDAVEMIRFLFSSRDPLPCLEAGDANADAEIDVSDPIFILNHVFGSGEAPASPYPTCGPVTGAFACSLGGFCENSR